jgi:hypothetical protein
MAGEARPETAKKWGLTPISIEKDIYFQQLGGFAALYATQGVDIVSTVV